MNDKVKVIDNRSRKPIDIKDILKQKQNSPPNQQPGMPDFTKFENMCCPDCGNLEFIPVNRLKFMNRFNSPNGQEGTVTLSQNVCRKCNTPFDMNKWKKMKEEKIIDTEKKEDGN